ncbi:uncharacterized protein LOC131165423 isoform X2 [Malania oleifera]|uniref:uncharacterized protein LOC131165423 isoform X2 n=1 Tax=Malania oleifera TaxID=397392 RepID=UPI0025AEC020|nr:uncharacterized protein LOC131165423 isoform X2 [Malania oleifera]
MHGTMDVSGQPSSQCPQCNAVCVLRDVRKLYASPVAVQGDNLQKKVKSLEAEIGSLRTERANLLDIQDTLLNVQDNLLKALHHLQSPVCGAGAHMVDGFISGKEFQHGQSGPRCQLHFRGEGSLHCNFVLEHELAVESARHFDMNVSYQILILARRASGMSGAHMLNKINLIYPRENEDIQLPASTKAVKDLHVSSCGRLVLLASLGKQISILSMGDNSVVLTYDLPAPAWSCSWDLNSPNFMYAGLQNGMLLVFDMRQSGRLLGSMCGLATHPIHTIHSLLHNPAHGCIDRKLLTAASIGPCVWNTSCHRERPFLVPGLENQGICTSLAYNASSDDIVVSYRPKVQASTGTVTSLSSRPHSDAVLEQGILGSQVHLKRVAGSFYHKLGSAPACVGDVQMTKSTIINVENRYPLFAYGDELTHGLRLAELPSLNVTQNLKPHQHPILDVKYAHYGVSGLLGCISKDKLQLFSRKIQ